MALTKKNIAALTSIREKAKEVQHAWDVMRCWTEPQLPSTTPNTNCREYRRDMRECKKLEDELVYLVLTLLDQRKL